MPSNKSNPIHSRNALPPQRSHGKQRVAELLAAGSAVIAERGFEVATMAEIAARAGAQIGSLYRFFPNKEVLGDALLNQFKERINESIEIIRGSIGSISIQDLAKALLGLFDMVEGERPAIRALLEARANSSGLRNEFRRSVREQIAKLLLERCPSLDPDIAKHMGVVLLQNLKGLGALREELDEAAFDRSKGEVLEMTRLYLGARLGQP